MGARLNARLETLDIDDVFFETTAILELFNCGLQFSFFWGYYES